LEEHPAEPGAGQSPWLWIIPNFTVFVSSLCIMVVELVAGRLIARHVGSSLYTWTSVIGIVLAGIAAGNYLGGRLADRYRPREALASLFLLASAACLLIPVTNGWVGSASLLRGQDWASRIALHVLLVFFLPSALMGTISPVAAKMALELGRQTGRTVGSVYSWGAVGSIVGTFLTGYFLIAKMGTVAVLLTVSGVLVAMALFFGSKTILPFFWSGVIGASFLVMLGPWDWAHTAGERLGFRDYDSDSVYFREESQYSRIQVEDETTMDGVRSMTLDHLIHAYIRVDDPTDLQYDYEDLYAEITAAAVASWPPERKPRALFLGGGGFVFPRWLLQRWPDGYAEVAEIDPEVTRAAFEAFGLERNTPMKIFDLDARNHVEDLLDRRRRGAMPETFDLVYADAFNHYSPPFHLTTLEFNEKLRQLMRPDGVFLANIIDLYRTGRFLGAVINTVEKTFPHVYALTSTIGGPSDEDERDTFVVVGSTRPLPLDGIAGKGCSCWLLQPKQLAVLRERSQGMVLTDDYAPVDNLLAPVVRAAEK
jgi:spermidine synthase